MSIQRLLTAHILARTCDVSRPVQRFQGPGAKLKFGALPDGHFFGGIKPFLGAITTLKIIR
jgi:hypothetical protein